MIKIKIPLITILIIVGFLISVQTFGFINLYGNFDEDLIGSWSLDDVSMMNITEQKGINTEILNRIEDSELLGLEIEFNDDGTCHCLLMKEDPTTFHTEDNSLLVIELSDGPQNYSYCFNGEHNEFLNLRFVRDETLTTHRYKKQ